MPLIMNLQPRSLVLLAKSFAKRTPIGDVATDDLRKSITRETVDTFVNKLGLGNTITSINRSTVAGITTVTLEREHGFNGIVTYSTLTGGSGFTAGTYEQVKLLNVDLLLEHMSRLNC
jgi:hypothetical protein